MTQVLSLSREQIESLTHDELSEHLRLAKANPGHYQFVVEGLREELANRAPTKNYRCLKCNHEKFDQKHLRGSSSFGWSYFNIDDARYLAVVCQRCKFTEFYEGRTTDIDKVIEAFGA